MAEAGLIEYPKIGDILQNKNPGYYFAGFSHIDDLVPAGRYRLIVSIENQIVPTPLNSHPSLGWRWVHPQGPGLLREGVHQQARPDDPQRHLQPHAV